jgi:hypothetical protein
MGIGKNVFSACRVSAGEQPAGGPVQVQWELLHTGTMQDLRSLVRRAAGATATTCTLADSVGRVYGKLGACDLKEFRMLLLCLPAHCSVRPRASVASPSTLTALM